MLLHSIDTYHGQQTSPDGRIVHCYRAVCKAEIFSLKPFNQKQIIAVGVAPHAQCAKCFKAGGAMKENGDLHGGGLSHDVYDEKGNKAKTEIDNSKMGTPVELQDALKNLKVLKQEIDDPFVRKAHDDNGLGTLEGGDFV